MSNIKKLVMKDLKGNNLKYFNTKKEAVSFVQTLDQVKDKGLTFNAIYTKIVKASKGSYSQKTAFGYKWVEIKNFKPLEREVKKSFNLSERLVMDLNTLKERYGQKTEAAALRMAIKIALGKEGG